MSFLILTIILLMSLYSNASTSYTLHYFTDLPPISYFSFSALVDGKKKLEVTCLKGFDFLYKMLWDLICVCLVYMSLPQTLLCIDRNVLNK